MKIDKKTLDLIDSCDNQFRRNLILGKLGERFIQLEATLALYNAELLSIDCGYDLVLTDDIQKHLKQNEALALDKTVSPAEAWFVQVKTRREDTDYLKKHPKWGWRNLIDYEQLTRFIAFQIPERDYRVYQENDHAILVCCTITESNGEAFYVWLDNQMLVRLVNNNVAVLQKKAPKGNPREDQRVIGIAWYKRKKDDQIFAMIAKPNLDGHGDDWFAAAPIKWLDDRYLDLSRIRETEE